ncbi:MAG: lysophospholipid acyltransferase family protein [Eikenella sp.]|nr:lysophospholipid acyltransferase family protein [Eikenella sp.]
MQTLIFLLCRFLSMLPLRVLHILGSMAGRLFYWLSPAGRRRVRRHLQAAGIIADKAMVQSVFRETARGVLELPVAFFRPPADIAALFREVHGWEHVQAALDAGEGLLLITPHLGSYDLAGRYLSHRLPFPLTAMYKPPKIKALDAVMQAGRVRDKGRTAPTNRQGVKQIIQALRQGEATIVLPDHVPDEHGDGVWVPFFGRYAYTMTLAAKLAQVKNVRTLFFCGRRLPHSEGFALYIEPLQGSLNGDKHHDAEIINRNVEAWVRRFPEQYLFAYNRYKHPAGAPHCPADEGQAT